MAAKQMGVTTGGNIKKFIGTHQERLDLPTIMLNGEEAFGPGSKYWEKDTKTGWIWDGSAWTSVI